MSEWLSARLHIEFDTLTEQGLAYDNEESEEIVFEFTAQNIDAAENELYSRGYKTVGEWKDEGDEYFTIWVEAHDE